MSVFFHSLLVRRSLELVANTDDLKSSFLHLQSRFALAQLLDCSLQQLTYWAQIAEPSKRYTQFEIAKANGAKRVIEAPSPVLRVLQAKLLQALEASYEPRAPVHGFVKRRSILTNASAHAHRAWVLNIDLSDFFPTIHFGRVRGIFQAKPFVHSEPVARTIAQLVCSQGRLPQGAPTSPIISNIVCAKMDGELRRFAKEHGAIYTRYADDITFSVRRRSFPQAVAVVTQSDTGSFLVELSQSLRSIILTNGFEINEAKVRIQPWKRSQRVTGLVVNEKPNIPRRFVRRTRAMLHSWERYGYDAAEKEFLQKYAVRGDRKNPSPSFRRRVRGNIAYIGQIRGRDDAIFVRLLTKYHVLIGSPLLGVPTAMTTNTTQRDVFICHASEDKRLVVEPLVGALEKEDFSVWFDKAEIKWGDSITGKVNEGLASSRYVIVVVSAAFMNKGWPQKELNAALAREIGSGKTYVLPLMVGSENEVAMFQSKLPLQADKLHLRWSSGPESVVEALTTLLR
jgi:retron-type reverse transcriptase